ncbi:hypothetical protein F5Y19DRAFT_389422 [Xylariaceae sp. FL1651]|nr:hypothetical protein F5Y19DRAFT_389422 [Xylariaceae sp. FL1651]
MASRFVSGGTIAGDGAVETKTEENTNAEAKGSRSNAVEWEAVQKDLEEERKKRADARRAAVEGGVADGERSLYEILQANKAAKQAAFEEQNRIRNQFRALDDDEIEFLEGVHDERRAEEDRVKRETEERLASFRKAQRGAVGADADAGAEGVVDGDIAAEEWVAAGGRKRKREKEKERGGFKGLKRRTSMPDANDENHKEGDKSSTAEAGKDATKGEAKDTEELKTTESKPRSVAATAPAEATKPKPSLVDYGSDEDDDD